MAAITERHISDFNVLIGYNMFKFLDEHFEFYQDDFPRIVAFFDGTAESLSEEVTRNYELLSKKAEVIAGIIRDRKNVLTAYVHWEIVDYFEDIRSNLKTVPVLWKYFRSNRTNFDWKNTYEFGHITAKNQTLEGLAAGIEGDIDYHNSWHEIALRNNLMEVDYDLEGGKNVILSLNLETRLFSVTSVLDSALGKKILGKDVKKEMEFDDNDVVILGYDETYQQSVDTMVGLAKGNSPEFRFLGRDVLVGGNVKTFGVASLTRQFQQVFSTDDSISTVKIGNISIQGSDVSISLFIESRAGNIVNQEIQI